MFILFFVVYFVGLQLWQSTAAEIPTTAAAAATSDDGDHHGEFYQVTNHHNHQEEQLEQQQCAFNKRDTKAARAEDRGPSRRLAQQNTRLAVQRSAHASKYGARQR